MLLFECAPCEGHQHHDEPAVYGIRQCDRQFNTQVSQLNAQRGKKIKIISCICCSDRVIYFDHSGMAFSSSRPSAFFFISLSEFHETFHWLR